MATVEPYRVNRRIPLVVDVALIVAAVVGAVGLGVLAERLIGFGNIMSRVLLPPLVLAASVRMRTALVVDEAGMSVGRKTIVWPDVEEVVVLGPARRDGTIEIGARRRGWWELTPETRDRTHRPGPASEGPRDRFDPRRLRAACREAPSTRDCCRTTPPTTSDPGPVSEAASMAATDSTASRVLPQPGGPVSVTRRACRVPQLRPWPGRDRRNS